MREHTTVITEPMNEAGVKLPKHDVKVAHVPYGPTEDDLKKMIHELDSGKIVAAGLVVAGVPAVLRGGNPKNPVVI